MTAKILKVLELLFKIPEQTSEYQSAKLHHQSHCKTKEKTTLTASVTEHISRVERWRECQLVHRWKVNLYVESPG